MYCRVIQYGDQYEVFKYEQPLFPRLYSFKDNYRYFVPSNLRFKPLKPGEVYTRSSFSTRRAKTEFLRLTHHNCYHAKTRFFLTLSYGYPQTNLRQARQHLSVFFSYVRESYGSISYIALPELTKAGTIHFHLLVFGLPYHLQAKERFYRILQRMWCRGYVDLSPAPNLSLAISYYMAKYMQKSFSILQSKGSRNYYSSRNIKKIYGYGFNSTSSHASLIYPDSSSIVSLKQSVYPTKYFGRYVHSSYTCLLYTSPSPRDRTRSRMPSSA